MFKIDKRCFKRTREITNFSNKEFVLLLYMQNETKMKQWKFVYCFKLEINNGVA